MLQITIDSISFLVNAFYQITTGNHTFFMHLFPLISDHRWNLRYWSPVIPNLAQ